MTLFLDASAIVAILALEPGYEALIDEADRAERLITSGIARWEAFRALTKYLGGSNELAAQNLDDYFAAYGITTVAVGEPETLWALTAHQTYGKGNHPAQLNMGDCFAYACAKANSAKLLYKGDDFAKTDLA